MFANGGLQTFCAGLRNFKKAQATDNKPQGTDSVTPRVAAEFLASAPCCELAKQAGT